MAVVVFAMQSDVEGEADKQGAVGEAANDGKLRDRTEKTMAVNSLIFFILVLIGYDPDNSGLVKN